MSWVQKWSCDCKTADKLSAQWRQSSQVSVTGCRVASIVQRDELSPSHIVAGDHHCESTFVTKSPIPLFVNQPFRSSLLWFTFHTCCVLLCQTSQAMFVKSFKIYCAPYLLINNYLVNKSKTKIRIVLLKGYAMIFTNNLFTTPYQNMNCMYFVIA